MVAAWTNGDVHDNLYVIFRDNYNKSVFLCKDTFKRTIRNTYIGSDYISKDKQGTEIKKCLLLRNSFEIPLPEALGMEGMRRNPEGIYGILGLSQEQE